MLAELRSRSQITIPAEIIKKFGVKEGDLFDIIETEGGILLCPVVVYPKGKLEQLNKLIKEVEKDVSEGNSKVYRDVDKMFKDLGLDV